jgi:cellulose synthase/poly-beta-1,6-N-acetylglucosamine synthase-like glycosyltransferase
LLTGFIEMVKFSYWLSLALLFYIYIGYPLLVYALGRLRPTHVHKAEQTPAVSVLISAYNEEKDIGKTIENKLALNYPEDKLEIIVISDSSTDRTQAIIEEYVQSKGHGRVKLLIQSPRQGKTAAINTAATIARGEILVFSDANSLYESDALRKLVRNFSDSRVGYVTGKMVYGNPDGTTVGDGCSTYMRYENFLRDCETRVGSVVGVDGGIDAVRKSLYQPMRPDQLPDFVLPLKVVEQGYRVVYEPEAILREETLKSGNAEYRMRVRVALRALWALKDMRKLLSPVATPLFALQLMSHKVLRYLAFLFMMTLYGANVWLWPDHAFYQLTLVIQMAFYAGAGVGYLLERRGYSNRLFYLPYYFVLINTGAAHAFVKFLMGKKQVLWVPRAG